MLTALILIAISIVVHHYLKPFENPRLGALEELSLYTIFLTYFLCLYSTYYTNPPPEFVWFGIVIMCINVFTITAFLWCIFVEFQASVLALVSSRPPYSLW
jgi:hypothetical protein